MSVNDRASAASPCSPRVQLSAEDVKRDVDVVLWSMRLCSIRRYFHQRFWEAETLDAEYAARVEPGIRLESVAEHSWHVADTVLLLAGHFDWLDLNRSVALALLHDKMEIVIGDKNPVGRSGTGLTTHAFNVDRRFLKENSERAAVAKYLWKLRPSARASQERLLLELLDGSTEESRFVKAIDKLQALAFVILKKKGNFLDKHLRFTVKYSEKVVGYFPPLRCHYDEIRSRLLVQVARRRGTTVGRLEGVIQDVQLPLFELPGRQA